MAKQEEIKRTTRERTTVDRTTVRWTVTGARSAEEANRLLDEAQAKYKRTGRI
jgi:uncharacterized OsmC-like protein